MVILNKCEIDDGVDSWVYVIDEIGNKVNWFVYFVRNVYFV